jgi:hypothetical protein
MVAAQQAMTTTAMLDKTGLAAFHKELSGHINHDDDAYSAAISAPLSHAAGDVAGVVERLERRAKTMNGAQPVGAGDGNTYTVGYYSLGDNKLDTEAATALLALSAENAGMRELLERTERNRDMWKGQVDRQAAALTEIRAELAVWQDAKHSSRWKRRAEAAEARVKEMEAALEPFAKLADELFRIDDGREMNASKRDDAGVWGFDRVTITYGDFRAARSLSPIKEAGNV